MPTWMDWIDLITLLLIRGASFFLAGQALSYAIRSEPFQASGWVWTLVFLCCGYAISGAMKRKFEEVEKRK